MIGTDEATGVAIANRASGVGSEIDVLGGNASVGTIDLYLKFTPSDPVGTVRVTINQSRIPGQSYGFKGFSVDGSVQNGMAYLGRFECGRYLTATIVNSLQTGVLTNASLLYSLEKDDKVGGGGGAAATLEAGYFGDGSDGALVFDGIATILGVVPSGNVYTFLRSIYPTTCTINNGVTVSIPGGKVIASVSITNNGTISGNGTAGGNGGSGAVASGGTLGTYANNNGVGDFASAGVTSGAPLGSVGVTTGNSAAVTSSGGTYGSVTGTSGIGGVGGTGATGTPGAVSASSAIFRPQRNFSIAYVPNAAGSPPASGGSGGTGTGSNGGGGGGAPGSGGGGLFIAAPTITNNGTISSNGGNGGNGGAGYASALTGCGGGGGGGGAAGGVILLVYNTITLGTVTVTGGTKGTGGAGTGGGTNGSDGNNGGAGVILKYNGTTHAFVA